MAAQKKGLMKALEDLIAEPDAKAGKLKILIVGTEASPYASVGGFASVLGYLSRSLEDLGNDVRIFIPKFGHIDEEYDIGMVHQGLKVPTNDESTKHLICNVKEARNPVGVPIFFLENQEYYEKRANVYGYSDDPTRWALLSRGVLEFIKTGVFVPDIIHVNDWHTGIVPNYLSTVYAKDPVLSKIATVFTIHNMTFQGMFNHHNVPELDLDDGRSEVAPFFSERLSKQNYLRRGILYSDVVSTVSKKYAKEVLTPDYGEGLDKLLLEVKGKFFGIINGLDYDEFNPKTDKLISTNYDVDSLKNRDTNKKALQKEYDLPINPDIPLLGFVGRLDFQKGVDLMIDTLVEVLKNHDIQFVQVGNGDPHIIQSLQGLKSKYPDKVGLHTYHDLNLPRKLFAGCDIILYPSRFEPCGIVQLEAMRYGAIPIVREVGGLADTVENFNSVDFTGTGFVFKEFDGFALYGQIVRAIELLKHRNIWKRLQKNAMKADFSWEASAKEYVRIYELARTFREKALKR